MNRDTLYLRHILDAIARIETYAAVGHERFLAETLSQDAIIWQLEIMGEATKRLSIDLRDRHPEIAWRRVSGLRDVLIHNYPGVELDVVWEITQQVLPKFKHHVEAILAEETQE